MSYLVYMHTSKTSGKSYIGVAKHGIDKRLNYHLWEASKGSTYHFHKALRLYGKDDFISVVLEDGLTEEQAYEREQHYIAEHATLHHGYNMTSGGDRGPVRMGDANGMYGKTHSDEAKHKMSEAKKQLIGEKHPHYGKPSPLKGKTYEEIVGAEKAMELRAQKRQLHLGRKRPYNKGENSHTKRPEVRAKMSAARKKPIWIDGVEYDCKMDACAKLGLSLYKLNKRLRT